MNDLDNSERNIERKFPKRRVTDTQRSAEKICMCSKLLTQDHSGHLHPTSHLLGIEGL